MNSINSVNINLDLCRPETQTIKVTIRFKPKSEYIRFSLPNWTPGSYTIRDHSQYLHQLRVKQHDENLEYSRLKTNCWSVSLSTLEELCIEYYVEAREYTVRTSYIDPNFSSLCLSSIVILVEEELNSKYILTLNVPKEWNTFVPLIKDKSGAYIAEDYHALLDAPIHNGNLTSHKFLVNGFQHTIVLVGICLDQLPSKFIDHLSLVCESTCLLFNMKEPPSGNNYQFTLHFLENGYGGLEHDNSSVLHFSLDLLNKDNGYRKLLQLLSHEYLHQWNIRRMRPIEMLDYNYNRPTITESLWFAEGVTSYYDMTIPFISGITDFSELLKDLSSELTRMMNSNGRFIQSLADSSREAWIKLYKSKANSRENTISYYNVGAILSFYLDIKLRKYNSSLAIILRNLWTKFGNLNSGYTRDDVKNELKLVSIELSEELDTILDSLETIKIDQILNEIGLKIKIDDDNQNISGFILKRRDENYYINRIIKGSPAEQCGLVIDDEIIAIGEFRLRSIDQVKNLFTIDKSTKITFVRNGRLSTTHLKPICSYDKKWTLLETEDCNLSAIKLKDKWMTFI